MPAAYSSGGVAGGREEGERRRGFKSPPVSLTWGPPVATTMQIDNPFYLALYDLYLNKCICKI